MPNCLQCSEEFEISEIDRDFYKKVSPSYAGVDFPIPDPTLCPLCRLQRRMVWRGELNLFRKESALSQKNIVTYFPPEADIRVYENEHWWSDKWDPLEYGRDFDFSRPFFEQFAELLREVPLMALNNHQNAENSDYNNCTSWLRNCYMLAGANHDEDCYYGNYVNKSRTCVDCNFISECELCYECVDCKNCYSLRYSTNCHNCSDSFFLQNCRGCSNCFACVNLVNKQYCFENEQLTEEEYRHRLEDAALNTRSGVSAARNRFDELRMNFPYKFMLGEMNENSTGNAVNNCKNSHHCFDVSDLEDCRFCTWLHQAKSCQDIFSWGFPAELCYECLEAGDQTYGNLFTITTWGSQRCAYCHSLGYSKDCFGSIGLKKAQYCIFNKQYSADDYENLVAKILSHMQETGEWGQFFPMSMSPLCYNTSVAQDYVPLDEEGAKFCGMSWHDFSTTDLKAEKALSPSNSIDSVSDDSLNQVFACSESGRPYKIIRQELNFYRKNKIPVPSFCFPERHKKRLARRNPRQLWERACDNCRVEIETSYPPYGNEIVYCEKCYLEAVY